MEEEENTIVRKQEAFHEDDDDNNDDDDNPGMNDRQLAENKLTAVLNKELSGFGEIMGFTG